MIPDNLYANESANHGLSQECNSLKPQIHSPEQVIVQDLPRLKIMGLGKAGCAMVNSLADLNYLAIKFICCGSKKRPVYTIFDYIENMDPDNIKLINKKSLTDKKNYRRYDFGYFFILRNR